MKQLEDLNQRLIDLCPELEELGLSERNETHDEIAQLRTAVQGTLFYLKGGGEIEPEQMESLVTEVRARLEKLEAPEFEEAPDTQRDTIPAPDDYPEDHWFI